MAAQRRRFLRLIGVAGVGALAGCSGGEQNTEADDSKTNGTETETETPQDDNSEPQAEIDPVQQAKLAANDGSSGDFFGSAVAVSSDGSTALVGASRDDDPNGKFAGSAYVFDRSGGSWTQQAKLAADDGNSRDRFGESVTLSSDGTTALIGAGSDTNAIGDRAGAAYVFDSSGGSWTQRDKLTAADGDKNGQFGKSVTLSSDGSTALIGATFGGSSNGNYTGSAYIFDNSEGTWTQRAKLTADDGDNNDRFGDSVALSSDGSTALVGAWDTADGSIGDTVGSAYVFDNAGGSWTQRAKLTAADGGSDDYFGWSVAVSNDGTTGLIGAWGSEGGGSAYVFDDSNNSWTQQAKVTSDDDDKNGQFGVSVALSDDGSTALIGDNGADSPNGEDTGAAYIADNSGGSWTQQSKLAAADGDSLDQFGMSVSLSSGTTTAHIGARRDDSNGRNAGSSYVFDMS